ncbi:uncharacterized protein MYCFIDRAFT_195259 [Pseudocercospora fijiensis CIRAD86]|uniref:Leucine rich repeat protein n=1 Tax=Pseudocercospora fijiensis (strain CIRAD86) TaxID=383855 RepID=M3B405_PSEFD|nr:uncharacterized protein MYCFIDRAFT_195259 [Pseudocercospora fijiensis CIRAD86]EME84113.1 hypothetical protein MYCFIDRAFT_195259 [Pseudocercospora fijiensis CIRAD86]
MYMGSDSFVRGGFEKARTVIITKKSKKMGGKSNKFDYTNRSNDGVKLGACMGRDLKNEANRTEKDAAKQANKANKARKTSTSSNSSSHEGNVIHPLDVKAPGKKLGDEGVFAMADGLIEALRKASASSAVQLEDLNLSGNNLTTVSLDHLVEAIELACYDLKTLDLSSNRIEVKTDEQAAHWERFLRSFRECRRLRRLDLSGNPLGTRALEILARVHIQEPHIDPMPPRGTMSVQSLPYSIADTIDPPTKSTYVNDKMVNGTFLRRRCGLRGIPYITLTDIGLTDAGALWLSYVLEDHHYPSQMIDELNATPPDSNIKTYQQDANFSGVDWNEREPTLGKDGLYLLKKSEMIRRQTFMDNATVSTANDDFDDFDDEVTPATQSPMKNAFDHRRRRAGDRRASVRSIRTTDGGEHELSELESARKKVQRHIIAQDGASSTELWRAGLRVAISSTVLNGIGPGPQAVRRYYVGPPIFHFPIEAETRKQASSPVTTTTAKGSPNGFPRQGTYAATLTANTGAVPGEPELAITEVTNSPQTPKMIFKPHRKGASSEGSDLHAVSQKLNGLIVRDDNPARFVRWQEEHGANQCGPGGFRDSAVLSHFPAKIIEKIAASSVAKKDQTLLSRKQIRSACAWGQDRGNFQTAETWRKMADSAQVWTLLESIGCLAYQRED